MPRSPLIEAQQKKFLDELRKDRRIQVTSQGTMRVNKVPSKSVQKEYQRLIILKKQEIIVARIIKALINYAKDRIIEEIKETLPKVGQWAWANVKSGSRSFASFIRSVFETNYAPEMESLDKIAHSFTETEFFSYLKQKIANKGLETTEAQIDTRIEAAQFSRGFKRQVNLLILESSGPSDLHSHTYARTIFRWLIILNPAESKLLDTLQNAAPGVQKYPNLNWIMELFGLGYKKDDCYHIREVIQGVADAPSALRDTPRAKL